jgi:predicted ABC-class ATPase
VNSEWVEARISISLPARGRTILGRKALGIFKTSLPFMVQNALYAHAYDLQKVQDFVEAVEDSDHLRDQIVKEGFAVREMVLISGYVAFIPNGAILPRQSGASDKPLQSSSVVPFQSPPSLEKIFPLPNNISITGMAIPAGITTIVGGGFHGKSTLLQAISLGVWNHIPGDGREYVVTNPTAVGVRSEDGRSVTGVDISPFISGLPGGATTEKWSSDDASGSTSMAAGLIEVGTLFIWGLKE